MTRIKNTNLEDSEKKVASLLSLIDTLKSNEARLNTELARSKMNLKSLEESHLILKKSLDHKSTNEKSFYISIIDNYKSNLKSEKIKNTNLKVQIELVKKDNINYVKSINAKNKIISTLNMENKIKISKIENMTINLSKLNKEKQSVEQILEEIKQDCNNSINKYNVLKHKNNILESRAMKIEDLKKELEKQKLNEILIKDKLKIVTQESENFKREIRSLVDQIKELEGQKTKHIFAGQGISDVLQELKECRIKNEELNNKLICDDQVIGTYKSGETKDLARTILKQKIFENTIYRLKKDITSLQNKLEQQKKIIKNLKTIIIYNKITENENKRNIIMCKQEVEHNYYEQIFCELNRLSQQKKIENLRIINYTKSEHIKLLQAQDTELCFKIKKLYNELHSKKKDHFNSQRIEGKLKMEIETLIKRHANYQQSLNTCQQDMRCDLNNAQKSNDLKTNQAAITKLQSEVHWLQGLLNDEKYKNNTLAEENKKQKEQMELNARINLEEINNVHEQYKILSHQNELLAYKNKTCVKMTNKNKLLKAELTNAQESNNYVQNKLNELKNERELKLNSSTIPEMIWPIMRKEREIKRRLIVQNIKYKSQAKNVERNGKLRWRF